MISVDSVAEIVSISPPCAWIDRDETGRPRCVHGPATKSGRFWSCPDKARERRRRYRTTEKGRATQARCNARIETRMSKHLYELTRVRLPH